jgi:hypothetical protein
MMEEIHSVVLAKAPAKFHTLHWRFLGGAHGRKAINSQTGKPLSSHVDEITPTVYMCRGFDETLMGRVDCLSCENR